MTDGIVIQRIDPTNASEMNVFLNFPLLLYGNNAKTKNGIAKSKQIVTATRNHTFLLIRRYGDIVGRMAVGCNTDIRDQDGSPYGQIGLFEVIEDFQVFSAMVDCGRELLKGKNRYILFPFFISTWYPYRFISKGFDSFDFFLESDNKDYYSSFSTRYGTDETFLYKSYLNSVDDFIDKNKNAYYKALSSGITFRHFNKSDIRNDLRIAYDLSVQLFSKNLFYGSISFERFLDIYLPSVKIMDKNSFLFALAENDTPIGFAFCIPDYTFLFNSTYMYSLPGKLCFLRKRNHVSGLIAKSGGVLTEYRNRGITGAMLYLQGLYARARNFRYIITALIQSQNPSVHLTSSNERIEKEYEMYKLSVSR